MDEFRVRKGRRSCVPRRILKENGATSFRARTLRGRTAEEKRGWARGGLGGTGGAVKGAARSHRRGRGVIFVYKATAKRVELVGDFTGWSPRGSCSCAKLPGTNAKLYPLRNSRTRARAEYKLVADGEWNLDPLNPEQESTTASAAELFLRDCQGTARSLGRRD